MRKDKVVRKGTTVRKDKLLRKEAVVIQKGSPSPLGATPDESGVNFAIWSSVAEAVDLCLFDEGGRQAASYRLPDVHNHIWHGYLPGCSSGQQYGFRVHGPWDPASGRRCNPAKLLLDPYARAINGEFSWHPSVLDTVFDESFDSGAGELDTRINLDDSAPFVPKCVVTAMSAPLPVGPHIPWSETIFYEANVRGYTMLHPDVGEKIRGTFAGMANGSVLAHLRALGITSLELMPVQAFVDENHLIESGRRNYWGYNTSSFFAPMPRLAAGNPVCEFREMVNTIHDAGIEVVLDIVFNHTGEGGTRGPSFGFRCIDNLAYYRTVPGDPGRYINDTGTGNTLNADHPIVQNFVLDCLRYWVTEMGVDGFRFDLASILGRHANGFSREHPLLARISNDPVLARTKLIAEPWDPGPGGYQLGRFPDRWAEWNDRYRDSVRRFWRGDTGWSGDFAKRLHGSADVFDAAGRPPSSSINFITSHDGFTLTDVVSFERRHNEDNGENNRDGQSHNYSCNYGIEGDVEDADIRARRRQHRLNLLATLFMSNGTPLLLAGDEFGNSQAGNNNAYMQDNPIGWTDWSGLESDPDFTEQVRKLIILRNQTNALRPNKYLHNVIDTTAGRVTVEWLNPDGESMRDHEWSDGRPMLVLLKLAQEETAALRLAIVVNGTSSGVEFVLPEPAGHEWRLVFLSSTKTRAPVSSRFVLGPNSMALLTSEIEHARQVAGGAAAHSNVSFQPPQSDILLKRTASSRSTSR